MTARLSSSPTLHVFAIIFTIVVGFRIPTCEAMTNMATYIFMHVTRAGDGDSLRLCANFHPGVSKIAPIARNVESAVPRVMSYYDDKRCRDDEETTIDGSSTFNGTIVHTYSNFDNKFVAGRRNNKKCPADGRRPMGVNEKISFLESENCGAILFLTTPYRTHSSFYDPRINDSLVSVPIFYIDQKTQEDLNKFVNPTDPPQLVRLRFYIPDDPMVDVAMFVILFIAMLCVAVGGAWSGAEHYQLYRAEVNKRLQLLASVGDPSSTSAHQPPTSLAAARPSDHRGDPAADHGGGKPPGSSAWAETSGGSSAGTGEPAAAPFNWITLIIFLCIVVGFLMLLYFAFNVVVWLTIVIYVFASSSAMCACLWYFLEKIHRWEYALRLDPLADALTSKCCQCCRWNVFRVTIQYRHAALYLLCAATAIVWCIFRHWSYSYILHDILATCFSIVTIRNLRLANLKWITCLLSLLLVYDLFMVFITPFMTKSGCSVMLDVATGGSCTRSKMTPTDATHNLPPADSPGEELPIVIRVPRFSDPMRPCYRMDVDLQYPPVILGLGDIILPGILVGYNAAYSLAAKSPFRLYYVASLVGYFVGMLCTFAALLLSKLAQPALIYLVPAVLIPTHVIAAIRKEWTKMWKGLFPLLEESFIPTKASAEEGAAAIGENEVLQNPDGTAAP